jgi:tetratricopeptide (TPR) repeat protein
MSASRFAAGDVAFDRFEVLAVGGVGGMALVYRARDRQTDRIVALKVLNDEKEAPRFRAEAETLARVKSPFVVAHVAHGDAPSPWLAMEWLEGVPLDQHIARGPMETADAVELVTRIARALGAAHALGIVHRDVKPENVILVGGRIDDPRLVDFGVARLPGRRFTEPGLVLGTPGFFAPEQARADAALDPRADVFALASLFFECVTGTPLWEGDSIVAVLTKILFEPAPRLDQVRPGVPVGLADLVERMLEKAPNARPRDGLEVAELLLSIDLRDTSLPPPPARSIGEIGRSVASVLVARLPRGALTPALSRRVRDLGTRYGASFEELADGSIAALVAGSHAATDLAAIATRLALAVRTVLPVHAIAVATGRASLGNRSELGRVIARAASLAAGDSDRGVVHVDVATADLLGSRFVMSASEGRLAVTGEADANADDGAEVRGRRGEIALVTQAFVECLAGRASMLVLVGEAGIGKSALASAARRVLLDHESIPTIASARGEPLSEHAPFGLVADLLRRMIGLPLASEPGVLDALATWIGARLDGADASRALTAIAELLRLGGGDGTQARSGFAPPGAFADRVHDALTALLRAECRGVPLVLVIEDLHFADAPSIDALAAILRRLPSEPLFVLATARPETATRFPALFANEHVRTLPVLPLSDDAMHGWVRDALGDGGDRRATDLVRAAAGSPFVLRELLRAAKSGATQTPTAATMVVHARLEALAPEQRRAMRAASVLGIADPIDVAHLTGDPRARDALESLVAEDVLVRDTRASDVRYAFKSRLLQEVAYGMLTAEDRALAHHLAAEQIASRGGTAALVAEHWTRAKRADRAAESFAIAARDALAASDVAGAATFADRGLASAPDVVTRADLLASLAEARLWRGDPAGGRIAADEARSLAAPGSLAEASALSVLLTAVARLGDVDALEAIASDAVLVQIKPETAPVMAHALARGGMNLLFLGRFGPGTALLTQLKELAEAVPEPAVQARWLQAQAVRAHYEGDLVLHVRFAEQALALLDALGDRRTAAVLRTNVGDALRSLGKLSDAEIALRDALETSRTLGIGSVEGPVRANLGSTLGRLGRFDEAIPLLESVEREFANAGDRRLAASAGMYLAEVRLDAGQLDAADRAIAKALEHSDAGTPLRPPALALYARIALARRHPDEALALAEQAMQELTAIGHVEDDEVGVHRSLVEVLAARGEIDRARDAARAGRDRLMELATKIHDDDYRAAFLRDVPAHRALLRMANELGV